MDRAQATLSLMLAVLATALVAAGPVTTPRTIADDSLCGCFDAAAATSPASDCCYDPLLGWYGVEQLAANLAHPAKPRFAKPAGAGNVHAENPFDGWDCLDDFYPYEPCFDGGSFQPTNAKRASIKRSVQRGSLAQLAADKRHSIGASMAMLINEPSYTLQPDDVLALTARRVGDLPDPPIAVPLNWSGPDGNAMVDVSCLLGTGLATQSAVPLPLHARDWHAGSRVVRPALVPGCDGGVSLVAHRPWRAPVAHSRGVEATELLVKHLVKRPLHTLSEVVLGSSTSTASVAATAMRQSAAAPLSITPAVEQPRPAVAGVRRIRSSELLVRHLVVRPIELLGDVLIGRGGAEPTAAKRQVSRDHGLPTAELPLGRQPEQPHKPSRLTR